MKRVLIPTDFSACANNATNTAIELAKKTGGELHFLHFTSIPIDWMNLTLSEEKMYPDITQKIKKCQTELNKLVKKCEKEGLKASSHIGYNESYQNIIDHIDTYKIDMVVMGSQGTTGIRELILGSNAQKVIRLSKVPVLIVKPGMSAFKPKKMVIVSDFPADLHALEPDKTFLKLMAVAKELQLPVAFVYVNTPAEFVTSYDIHEKMSHYEKMSDYPVTDKVIICDDTLEEGISYYLDENENTLIAMMTHGVKGIGKMFHKSQVESVANHIDAALLTVKMD